jgi:hypothetical protein
MAIGNIPDSTPVAAATPASTPDTSAASAPQPNTAQPTQATPAPTAQAAPPQNPDAPATAPARSLPPSRNTGVHGILGGVLMGALAGGVAHIAAKAGAGIKNRASNFVQNSPYAQELKNQALERQAKQQAMEEAKTKSVDEHTESMVRVNSMSLDNMHKVAENAHLDKMYPLIEGEQRGVLMKQVEEQNAVDRDLLSTLEQIGVHVDTSHFAEGEPWAQLTPTHATDIGQGNKFSLSNGETGPKADLAFVSNDELQQTVLPHDVSVATDWKMDPKTGAMTPIYSTLHAGHDTALTALIAHDAGMKNFNEYQGMYAKQLQAQSEAAKTGLEKAQTGEAQTAGTKNVAEAREADARAKLDLTQAGVGDPSLAGDAYIKSLPPLDQDLVNGLLHYQVKPADLGRGDRKAVLAAAIHASGGQWSDAQYNERYNFLKEWGDTKNGAGATKDRLNTAIGHLNYLASASKALANGDIVQLNKLANNLGVQTGNSAKIVYNAIAMKAAAEAAGAMKGGGNAPTDPEIESQFKSFDADNAPGQRMGNIGAQYGLLDTQADTLKSHFQQVMGVSSDQFGQPVLYPQNQQILSQWRGGGQQQQNLQPGQVSVTDPQGGIHTFPNQASADTFKTAAGIK